MNYTTLHFIFINTIISIRFELFTNMNKNVYPNNIFNIFKSMFFISMIYNSMYNAIVITMRDVIL